jgi:linoleoyl-CoA desaturase
MKKAIKFINKDKSVFFSTLKERVDKYFNENKKSKHADHTMVIKTIAMLSLYLIPYMLIMSNNFSVGQMLILAVIMGTGLAGIGMSVMHDANHGAYSSSMLINKLGGYSLNLIGANAFNWKIKHNILHHTYTNISNLDEDLDTEGTMRLSPYAERKYMHRYQHLYAFFIYGLVTLEWALARDFRSLIKYAKNGLILKVKLMTELAFLVFSKLVYFFFVFGFPLLLVDITWWQLLIGFFVLHFTAGVILASTFQLAHVVEATFYPSPDGNIENEWAIHQLITTSNFCRNNKLLSWFIGGLNFQIEHHLFPHVCHVHYRAISHIVKSTVEEFNLPYNEHPNLYSAYSSHFRLIKRLGKRDAVAVT